MSIGEFCRCGHSKFAHDHLFGCMLRFYLSKDDSTKVACECRRFYSVKKYAKLRDL